MLLLEKRSSQGGRFFIARQSAEIAFSSLAANYIASWITATPQVPIVKERFQPRP